MSDANVSVEVRIGFFTVTQAEGRYRGGLLVTDRRTVPLEFRCTTALSPSTMQRILYGRTLESTITIDLIGLPLLEGVSEKPTVIVSDNPVFLEARDAVSRPVVFVRRKLEPQHDSGSPVPPTKGPVVEAGADVFGSILLESHRSHPDDVHIAREALRDCDDLLEPFDRIVAAMDEDDRQKVS